MKKLNSQQSIEQKHFNNIKQGLKPEKRESNWSIKEYNFPKLNHINTINEIKVTKPKIVVGGVEEVDNSFYTSR